MHARRVGQHALLVECTDLDDVAATYAAVRSRAEELGATDVVPAARTVLLDGVRDPEVTMAVLRRLTATAVVRGAVDGGVVEIPVTYDGPDLGDVARQWDVEEADVVRIHRETEFVVAFCGFAPGFAYCAGLPEDRVVLRRDDSAVGKNGSGLISR